MQATYAELYFERDGLTLTILEDSLSETVRRLISAKEARALLTEIKEWDGRPSKQWKTRADANQAAIDRGEPLEYAKVFKGLRKLEAEGELRPRDRAHLNQSLEFLSAELAHSLGKTPEQARKMVTRAGG